MISFKPTLQIKISVIAIMVLAIAFSAFVFYAIKQEEAALLNEKEKASEMMARPILNSIYYDMLAERAEMVYYLMQGMKDVKGVERVQIVRGNGNEVAFNDDKTLKAVEEEYGELKTEWLTPRISYDTTAATGIESPGFKDAFQSLKNSIDATHYIETTGGKRLFTYIIPIEELKKCSACHKPGGGRGILMISTSLEDTYSTLAVRRNRWILLGLGAIGIVGIILSLSLRIGIIRHVEKMAQAAKGFAGGNFTHRVKVSSKDEIGSLADSMNEMAEQLHTLYSGLERQVEMKTEELQAAYEELTISNEDLQASYAELETTTAELEEANKRLADVNEELKGIDMLKTDFLQTISHELRSPLSPILGYLDLMQEGKAGELTPKQKSMLGEMHTCGRNMQLLVDEMLEVVSIEAGNLVLNFEDLDLHLILEQSINEIRRYVAEKKIEMVARIPSDPLWLMGDVRRLTDIFTHLLRNAVKFNNQGGKITVEVLNRDNGVEVIVSDTGIGIPREKLDRIFGLFYQVDSSSTRHHEGVGLGLYLVKRLVDLHSGAITVESEEGVGTRFSIFIPKNHQAVLSNQNRQLV